MPAVLAGRAVAGQGDRGEAPVDPGHKVEGEEDQGEVGLLVMSR